MARDSLTVGGGMGEGSHWLMANQADWNMGQTSYTHRSRSVRSQNATHIQAQEEGLQRSVETVFKICTKDDAYNMHSQRPSYCSEAEGGHVSTE